MNISEFQISALTTKEFQDIKMIITVRVGMELTPLIQFQGMLS